MLSVVIIWHSDPLKLLSCNKIEICMLSSSLSLHCHVTIHGKHCD